MLKLLNKRDIIKGIDKYYLNGENSEVIDCLIDNFLAWQIMASDRDIISLHDILQANGETVSSMIVSIAECGASGFCGIYGDNTTIQEEIETLREFHYYFRNKFELCRKVVTWDFSCMYRDKKEARDMMNEKGYKTLYDYAVNEMDIYDTENGFVEKIYY